MLRDIPASGETSSHHQLRHDPAAAEGTAVQRRRNPRNTCPWHSDGHHSSAGDLILYIVRALSDGNQRRLRTCQSIFCAQFGQPPLETEEFSFLAGSVVGTQRLSTSLMRREPWNSFKVSASEVCSKGPFTARA